MAEEYLSHEAFTIDARESFEKSLTHGHTRPTGSNPFMTAQNVSSLANVQAPQSAPTATPTQPSGNTSENGNGS